MLSILRKLAAVHAPRTIVREHKILLIVSLYMRPIDSLRRFQRLALSCGAWAQARGCVDFIRPAFGGN